ncbi:hypothetical protein HMPREF3037_01658 [Candidatus Stoquefichus sp. KLE1796]|nr:hypothetical protein HMPREF3037_01658 [Candidatus Stoquefichus sp. KLE1796]
MQKLFWWNLNEGEKYQRLKHMVWLYVTTSIILFYKCDCFMSINASCCFLYHRIKKIKRQNRTIGKTT